jgi:hypothetical protein
VTILNLTPLIDSLTGTAPTSATFKAEAMRAGRRATRMAGADVTFATELAATWDGTGWDVLPSLFVLPPDCYWKVRVAAAGNRLERTAILPADVDAVNFADLIDVTPETGQPDTTAIAQWLAVQQYVANQANRIDGVAATIFSTVGTVQAQINTAATATAQAAAAAAEAAAEQVALAADLADVTTNTQAATDAAAQAAADRAAADADATATAADRAAVATDRTAVETALAGGTVQDQIDAAVNGLINGAPGALNTLKELADAIGDDANFAATVTNALASKANLASLAAVALTGAYTDLTGRPVLGTAAVANATEFDPIGSAASAQSIAIQRANHTGTQSADTLTDGTTNKAFTAAERTKLAAIAAGATVNQSDAYLLARANHTGTQPASTITGLATVATTGAYSDLTGIPTVIDGNA